MTRSPGFQPTLPLRGATWASWLSFATCAVSTHAPLAGSDEDICCEMCDESVFQPTLPLRGATQRGYDVPLVLLVSTHAPLAGSDVS